MKKLAVLLLFVMNFLVLPTAFATDQVIIDRITQSQAEDLNITIPDNVPAGHHTVTIEVSDAKGEVSNKVIAFCKDNEGVVHWDDKCPNLKVVAPTNPQSTTPATSGQKPYDPMSDSKTTHGLQLAAFAALAALTSVKRNDKSDSQDDSEEESLQSVAAGELALINDDPGRGDLSQSWVNRFTDLTDLAIINLSRRFNRFSPLLTRTAQDGNTVRAVVGSWSALLLPLGAILGFVAAVNTNGQALPPTWEIVAAVMAVAIFDAFAGLIAGSVFFFLTFIIGGITNRPEFLTEIGVIVLCFAPALLASSFRPFRRRIESNDDLWERITDYALGTLLTFWVITKMVAAMNGLARLKLPITTHGTQLAIISSCLVLIRFAIEDLVAKNYPIRLKSLHVEVNSPTQRQKTGSVTFKIFTFFIMAAPFAGSLLNLTLGTILFAIPQITALRLEDGLPKKKFYLPKGVFKTVVMIFVMALVSKLIHGLFSSEASFLKWSFVVMALPGFFLHYLDAISDDPDSGWKQTENGRKIYRYGGLIIFGLMVLVVSGVDLAGWIH